MEVPEAMALLKKELATFINVMSDVPGIEEYQREMAELKALGRKCDELVDLTAQQEQLQSAVLQARAAADAAAQEVESTATEAAPYFAKGQALDPAEMKLTIQRLLQSVPDLFPNLPAQGAALGNVWELESVDWAVDSSAAEQPAPPAAEPPASQPAAPPDQNRSIGGSWSD